MQQIMKTVVAIVFLVLPVSQVEAINVTLAEVQGGVAVVEGNKAAKQASITWEGGVVTQTTKGGAFQFLGVVPPNCLGMLSDGVDTIEVVVLNCNRVLKTGQTTAFQADKNDGIVGVVNVDDDGTLQLGASLSYQDNGDGTVTDLNTGLMWEMKLAATDVAGNCSDATQSNRDLSCVNNVYHWSGDGSQETIWDWLDDLNAVNFAGHDDWRIPNLREFLGIVNYGLFNPAIDGVFGPTEPNFYWSSTTVVFRQSDAWVVSFFSGDDLDDVDKSTALRVRAVRTAP